MFSPMGNCVLSILITCWFIVFSSASPSSDLQLTLLRKNPATETNEGTIFLLGFFGLNAVDSSNFDTKLYISTNDPRGAEVVVETPKLPDLYPTMNFDISKGSTAVASFPTSSDRDIRVSSILQFANSIKVTSTNGAKISVLGINDGTATSDAFLALPCKSFRPEGAFRSSNTRQYRYFVFSSGHETDNVGTNQFESRVLIVNCVSEGTHTVTINAPEDSAADDRTIQLGGYETYLYQQSSIMTNGVRRPIDITGTVITSEQPISVFVGNECGQVPTGATACDVLVEQIPPHIVYGQRFFALPFALRESGDIFKIGSLANNNNVTITCSRATAGGSLTIYHPEGKVINFGEYHTFRTTERQNEQQPYYRDFCCIETSSPATVMQYALGHSIDTITIEEISAGAGDPAMTLVPPVSQYSNDFIINTMDDVLERGSMAFKSYVSWAVAAPFYSPGDENGFSVNNMDYPPPARNELGEASGGYIPIHCQNNEVCGYGAFGRFSELGNINLSYSSFRDPNAAVYASAYGFFQEASYAYPAGYECEPIGLPHISVYDITVRENVGTVTVQFNRTGGDLSLSSAIRASTVSTTEGAAVEMADYIPIDRRRIRWLFSNGDTTFPSADNDFTITIVDDNITEPTEYLEVHVDILSNGYLFPNQFARVTILDDDGATINFNPAKYEVEEGQTTNLELVLSRTLEKEATVQLNIEDVSTSGTSDYNIDSMQVTFAVGVARVLVSVDAISDRIDEGVEVFTVTLSDPSQGTSLGLNFIATVCITDPISVKFVPATYEVTEGEVVTFNVVLSSPSDSVVTVDFTTLDGSASVASDDYVGETITLTFPAGVTSMEIPISTLEDVVAESTEMFGAELSNPSEGVILGDQPLSTVNILDNEILMVELDPVEYTVAEGESASLTAVLNFVADRDVSVDLITQNGTAEAGFDYIPVTTTIVFPAGMTQVMVPVSSVEDMVAEVTESFGAVLTNPSDRLLIGMQDQATVTIIDDDDLMVSFDPIRYAVNEGEQVSIRAVLNSTADRDVMVEFTTDDGSAIAPDDYLTVVRTITFPAGTTEVSIAVNTTEDSISELPEQFTALLSNPSEGLVVGPMDTATVDIMDDDVTLIPEVVVAMENDPPRSYCVQTSPPAPEDLKIRVDIVDAVDGVSLSPSSFEVLIPAGEITGCGDIAFVDNKIGLQDDIVFPITVTVIDPPGLMTIAQESTLTIMDNDVLEVSFQRSVYHVMESEGPVETCLQMNCEAAKNVTVTISAQESEPQQARDDDDFEAEMATVTFAPGETVKCEDFTIIDNDIVEDLNEDFVVVIDEVSPGVVRVGENSSTTVRIMDDDMLSVMLTEEDYRVNETEGTVMVCVRRVGLSDSDITVTVTSRETSPASAVDGQDFDVASVEITIPPNQSEACADLPIRDDEIAMEGDEVFEVVLETPPGVPTSSQDPSTVTILDNDVIAVSFDPSDVHVAEDVPSGSTQVCLKGNTTSAEPYIVQVRSVMSGENPATPDVDYTVNQADLTLMFPAGEPVERCVPVGIVDDSVTSEGNETFMFVLDTLPEGVVPGENPEADVTIIDDDRDVTLIPEEVFAVEDDPPRSYCVQTSPPASEDLLVRVDIEDAVDGVSVSPSSFEVLIPAGEITGCGDISFVDNKIGLQDDIVFPITVTVIDPPGLMTIAQESTLTIVDDEVLEVSFARSEHDVLESEGPVQTCLQMNCEAAKSVTVTLSAQESEMTQARDVEDFQAERIDVIFSPGETEKCEDFTIVDDNTLEDLNEDFVVVIDEVSPEVVGVGENSSTTVTIMDDDSIRIIFTTPAVRVNEDVPSGSTQVCLIADSASARPYTVVVGRRPSGDNPATPGEDYTIESADLTVTIPAGEPMGQCIPVGIVDDEVALEGEETFQFFFETLPDNVITGDPDEAVVTIVDDDEMVVITFVSEDVIVNENNGTTFVCVERSAVTEFNMSIFIDVTFGSADVNDFTDPGMRELVFKPFENTTCTEVPIIDDDNIEQPEDFVVAFTGAQTPGVTMGGVTSSSVLIIDDDDDKQECTIREPLMVSPFNATPSYNFRGTCELVALRSCSGAEPGFAVRVDFLSDSDSNGAVGVYLDGLRWISREDGSFFSDVDADLPTTDPDVLEFSTHNIVVTMNKTERRTRIEVGGSIQVSVLHIYGDGGSVSLSVGSGSSLNESCGICGTQSGELVYLNGTAATNPAEQQSVVESYRIPAAEMSLRPIRPECANIDNDTIIGDPLFTTPMGEDLNLCFEVHGSSNKVFNLVSDTCVSVNALFSPVRDLNIISSIGVVAEGSDGVCRQVQVDLDRCAMSAGTRGNMAELDNFSEGSVVAVKTRTDRVRISVPNCDNLKLVMWVICERDGIDMIRFQIARGLNLAPTSHGLLGQFWNIPLLMEPYRPPRGSIVRGNRLYNVTVIPPDSPPRSFLGDLVPRTWDKTKERCLYVGNGQAGPSGTSDLRGSVIEGRYKNYIVESLFDPTFMYDRLQGACVDN